MNAKIETFLFDSRLTASISSTDVNLPIEKLTELSNKLTGYTYLVIRDKTKSEYVKVTKVGSLLNFQRGADNSIASAFPNGACVSTAITGQLIKDFMCQYTCCDDICCVPVKLETTSLPKAKVGIPYSANVVFSGSTPMAVSAGGLPSWLTYTKGANYLTLVGVPTSVGSQALGVNGTNCNGETVTAILTLITE